MTIPLEMNVPMENSDPVCPFDYILFPFSSHLFPKFEEAQEEQGLLGAGGLFLLPFFDNNDPSGNNAQTENVYSQK